MIEDMTPLRVVPVGIDEQSGATTMLRRYSDQDLTLADAVGLHVTEARRCPVCWSTDFHLGITGVTLVINEG